MKIKNVALIMCDQMQWQLLGCNGRGFPVRTPHLDRLAAESVVFDNAAATNPLCSPVRACLFTGMQPNATGVVFNSIAPRAGLPFLFEEFAAAGYDVRYSGKWHIAQPGPLERGAREYADAPHYAQWLRANRDYPPAALDANTRMHFGAGKIKRETSVVAEEDFHDTWLTDRALAMLDAQAASGAPFFLTLSLHGPHPPLSVPAPWSTMYDPAQVRLPPSFEDDHRDKPRQIFGEWGWKHANHLSADDWRDVTAHYWGYVSLIDKQVGRLLDRIDRLGLRDETLVVFLSDHGEMMGAHRFYDKAYFAYEEAIRIPLMFRLPGAAPGRRAHVVGTDDVAPTIREAAGLPAAPHATGRSLREVLVSPGTARWDKRAAFCSCNRFDHFFVAPIGRVGPWRVTDQMLDEVDTFKAVRTERWKYILHRFGNFEELYDLEADPFEMTNLLARGAPGARATADGLKGEIARAMVASGDPHCRLEWFRKELEPCAGQETDG